MTNSVTQAQPQSKQPTPTPDERRAARVAARELTIGKLAQEMRAEADAILAAHGIEVRARLVHAIAEVEAA